MLSEWEGGADPGGRPHRAPARCRIPTAPSPTTSAATRSPSPSRCRRSPAGRVGIFGYDLVRTVETTLGEPNPDPLGLPDLALMISDVLVAFDHQRHEVTLIVNAFAEDEGGIDAAYATRGGDDRVDEGNG